MTAEYQVIEGVAVVTVDNPPVNAISQTVRDGIIKGIDRASADPEAQSVLLRCEGKTFMAGADISEFDKPALAPSLPDVVNCIEACPKPVVALIHGYALGGGLEIAMACHYRIAQEGAKLGLTETNLGLIPGAGGTQRLPRLVGVSKALDMITGGKIISSEEALESKLVDKLIGHLPEKSDEPQNMLKVALNYCQKVPQQTPVLRRLSQAPMPHQVAEGVFDEWRTKMHKRKRNLNAVQSAIDAVEASTKQPFDEAIKLERNLFMLLRESQQAKALRHIFFAEKKAGQFNTKSVPSTQKIQKVAVIGAGTMGTGIAMAFSNAGYPVLLLEKSHVALEQGITRIEKMLASSIKREKITAAQADKSRNLITPTTDYQSLQDVDMVIEAVFEDLEVKSQVFAQIHEHCRSDAIIASNTSYLDINVLAMGSPYPENIIGMHFFSPANIMKLVEVIRTDYCSEATLTTAIKVLKHLNKVSVISGVCHGFIGNRMYQSYQREVGLLLLEGASPKQIDQALYNFGMAMGPLSVADMSGLDISYMMRKSLNKEDYDSRAFLVHDRLVESNRKGRKTHSGFYKYDENGKKLGTDPSVLQLIAATASELGFQPREVKDNEIIDRCILALVNEGAHILDEGIAASASDIDVVYVNGYGFPRHLGGPMHYAQASGLDHVAKTIDQFSSSYGDRWWKSAASLRAGSQNGKWEEVV
ncbi:3-hydroxyacyl-CoA dehydrogenase NAD-binding domain-containing protein [Photobacterium sanctipauli]|nr:3-hydroxyacyl-CoA dehydrogenase NAD-binding domain-containing protein [Photobacterium sanctipauli]